MLNKLGAWLAIAVSAGGLIWALQGRMTTMEARLAVVEEAARDTSGLRAALHAAQLASAAQEQRLKSVEQGVEDVKRVVLEQRTEQREQGKDVTIIRENVAGLRALLQQQERDRRASVGD